MITNNELIEMKKRFDDEYSQLIKGESIVREYKRKVRDQKVEKLKVLKSFESEMIKMFKEEYQARTVYPDYYGINSEIGEFRILLDMEDDESFRIHFHFDKTSKPELTDSFYRTYVTFDKVNEKFAEAKEKIEEVLNMRNDN